jgi:CheY-like chemotaxis protein
MLEHDGWVVTETSQGRDALKQVAESLPDVVLLDLTLPEMNGFQFIYTLRKNPHWKSIPILVFTGKHLTAQEQQWLKGTVQGVIPKGRDHVDTLCQTLRDLAASRARAS